jgi:hypothetical protein
MGGEGGAGGWLVTNPLFSECYLDTVNSTSKAYHLCFVLSKWFNFEFRLDVVTLVLVTLCLRFYS